MNILYAGHVTVANLIHPWVQSGQGIGAQIAEEISFEISFGIRAFGTIIGWRTRRADPHSLGPIFPVGFNQISRMDNDPQTFIFVRK